MANACPGALERLGVGGELVGDRAVEGEAALLGQSMGVHSFNCNADPWMSVLAILRLGGVALGAALIPARRAAAIDRAEALGAE